MNERIFSVSCSPDLAMIGLDRMRASVEGLEENELSLDWSRVRITPVVADERLPFEAGELKIVRIRPIEVSGYSLVFLSLYGSNGMGHLCCIGCMQMKKYSENRTASLAMFHSRIKSSVLKGDLLGQVIVVPGKNI